MRDIEGHGSLVQIVEPEEKAAIMMRRLVDEWTDSARGVAAGRFDLDDVGAHVGEQARGKMGAIGAQIEHAQARKRAVAHYLTLPGALPRFSISKGLRSSVGSISFRTSLWGPVRTPPRTRMVSKVSGLTHRTPSTAGLACPSSSTGPTAT